MDLSCRLYTSKTNEGLDMSRASVSPVGGVYDTAKVISHGYLYTKDGSRLDVMDANLTADCHLRVTPYPIEGKSVAVERKDKASYIFCVGTTSTFVATNFVMQDRLMRKLDKNMYDKIVDNLDAIKNFLELIEGDGI